MQLTDIPIIPDLDEIQEDSALSDINAPAYVSLFIVTG